MTPVEEDWGSWEKLVIYRLDLLDKKFEKLEGEVRKLHLTATAYGAVGACIIWLVGFLKPFFFKSF